MKNNTLSGFLNPVEQSAFTLAEIMIALVVIGVITSIILPVAFNNVPDENLMKFKKGNTTLAKTINELVTSEKYYCNGDLGLKSDCTTEILNSTSTKTYLCETIADILTTKSVNCNSATNERASSLVLLSNEVINDIATGEKTKSVVTNETIQSAKNNFDEYCKKSANIIGKEIITSDNIVYYQSGDAQFGSKSIKANSGTGTEDDSTENTVYLRFFSPPSQFPANYADENGIDIAYKVFCMDVDGFDETKGSKKCDDIKDICPFGYGIRADGRILTGKRADEWLKKSLQDKE